MTEENRAPPRAEEEKKPKAYGILLDGSLTELEVLTKEPDPSRALREAEELRDGLRIVASQLAQATLLASTMPYLVREVRRITEMASNFALGASPRLKDRIKTVLDLTPGLDDVEIAERLGVPAFDVAEALRELASEGKVKPSAGEGKA